ncbi:anti-sigma regulatory factor [Microaerobacter geothermalis]|uniref:anti-sigma regulatory factor n=1 Tax=Microaerobacter geothermalis TaxID=674972 RepID=UPI001F194A5B|nr:anti-sigma regulatory factor [Microaerobacter geothermalis]MCF6093755.1 anti-sigma regulatory factor [Microaerobacter geothermalis]
MEMTSCVQIESEMDIVSARKIGRDLAKKMGFGEVDQARIAATISELARNIYLYAGKGTICIYQIAEDGRQGLTIDAVDNGPGIDDIQRAMEDGFSTSGGLGAGLPGVKRLMDTISVHSERGKGTKISVTKWRS